MNVQDETVGPRDFATTHWSVVIDAAAKDSTNRRIALESLCADYWYPLYFYVRRQGKNDHEAKDLIQGFFSKLWEKRYLQTVCPEKGRFRAFMMMAIKRYMANEWKKEQAAKRGGQVAHISFNCDGADERYAHEGDSALSVEEQFDRQWALTILNTVFHRLAEDYQKRGKEELYQFLRTTLPGQSQIMSYEEDARHFDLSLNTIKSETYRLRKRFKDFLRNTVENTLLEGQDIDEELRYLIKILA